MDRQTPSRAQLLLMAAARAVAGFAFIACLLFIPAGTLRYWQAWLYLGVLFVPLLLVGTVLLLKDPELLERRMRMREREAPQKRVIVFSALVLAAVFLIPGLDQRYGWSKVPPVLVLIADAVVLLGYALFVLTLRENRYASRVVEVQQAQVVVSTGPHALVRHPMYLSVILIFCLTPLALGSYWGMVPALLLPIVLLFRIGNEEELLRRELDEYEQYCHKVKYRLLPYIW